METERRFDAIRVDEFARRKEVDLLINLLESKIGRIENEYSKRVGGKQWSDYMLAAIISMAMFLVFHYVWKF